MLITSSWDNRSGWLVIDLWRDDSTLIFFLCWLLYPSIAHAMHIYYVIITVLGEGFINCDNLYPIKFWWNKNTVDLGLFFHQRRNCVRFVRKLFTINLTLVIIIKQCLQLLNSQGYVFPLDRLRIRSFNTIFEFYLWTTASQIPVILYIATWTRSRQLKFTLFPNSNTNPFRATCT
jgi:hypothetical protein